MTNEKKVEKIKLKDKKTLVKQPKNDEPEKAEPKKNTSEDTEKNEGKKVVSHIYDVNKEGDKFKIVINEKTGATRVYEEVLSENSKVATWVAVRDYSTICRVFYYHTKGGW